MSRSRTRLAQPRRRSRVVMILVLVVFINLPAVHSTWSRWRVDQAGVEATVPVENTEVLGSEDDPHYWVAFRYPEGVDVDESLWPAEVDGATYEQVTATGEIGVRYLETRPSAYEVDGQVRRWTGLVTTLVADLLLLLVMLLVWRFGGRRRPLPLRIAAIGDLERCPPGGRLEQVEGDLYLVCGEVSVIDDDEVVLDLGDRDVVVILDGHHNPVGHQQPAQARGRLLP